MKKTFIFLIFVFAFISIAPLASSAHIFCNCPVPAGHDCSAACQNQPNQATVCQCEGAMVTFPSVSTSDCVQKCEKTYNPQNVAEKKYKICNCTVGTPYADDDICKKTCAAKSEFKDKTVCACTESTKEPKLAEEKSLPEKETECEKYCKPEDKPTPTTTTEAAPPEFGEAIKPKIYVAIPDLKLSDLKVPIGGDESVQISFPWIAQYIIAVYKYALGFASILAVIMIMAAGILYLVSAGNPQRISQAKNYIIGAITGLIIIVGSYTILNLISPQLTQLGSVELKTVTEAELEEEFMNAEIEGRTSSSQNNIAFASIPIEHRGKECNIPNTASGIGDPTLMEKYPDTACLAVGHRNVASISQVTIHEGNTAERNVKQWLYGKKGYVKTGKVTSSHYTIERSGKIYQHLDEAKVGIHAPGQNSISIGIDLTTNVFAGYRYGKIDECLENCKKGVYPCKGEKNNKELAIKNCTPVYTAAQISSLKKLLSNIAARTAYKFDFQHTWSHCEGGGHSDPRNFKWEDIGQNTQQHSDRDKQKPKRLCRYYPEYEERVRELADQIFGQ